MSPTPSISFAAREAVVSRLLDPETGFNYIFPITAGIYGVEAFTLSKDSPANLFTGNYDYPSLRMAYNDSDPFPCAVVSIGESNAAGKTAMRITPSTFSGMIAISTDFYVKYPDGSVPPDGDAMVCAIEDAYYGALNGNINGIPAYSAINQNGLMTNNEAQMRASKLTFNQVRWEQVIFFTSFFNRVV